MIFVTLGSQKFQFNRLLKILDELKKNNLIIDEIFAQIGYSDYKPSFYDYKDFLNQDDYKTKMNMADLIITHGGTGAIINAVKKEKKVIAVPRLVEYQEHVDNHQIQIVEQFDSMNLIKGCFDCNQLCKAINEARKSSFRLYKSNTDVMIKSLDDFICSCFN